MIKTIIKKNYIPASDLIMKLIKDTKFNEITWINMDYLKSYLRKDGISINDIRVLRDFLLYLQSERFIFDCENTYLSKSEDCLFIVSKSKYSNEYRVDYYDFNLKSAWNKAICSFSHILRLRNIIEISREDNESECAEFLTTISLNSRV